MRAPLTEACSILMACAANRGRISSIIGVAASKQTSQQQINKKQGQQEQQQQQGRDFSKEQACSNKAGRHNEHAAFGLSFLQQYRWTWQPPKVADFMQQ